MIIIKKDLKFKRENKSKHIITSAIIEEKISKQYLFTNNKLPRIANARLAKAVLLVLLHIQLLKRIDLS